VLAASCTVSSIDLKLCPHLRLAPPLFIDKLSFPT
jgi:hypothetical protein